MSIPNSHKSGQPRSKDKDSPHQFPTSASPLGKSPVKVSGTGKVPISPTAPKTLSFAPSVSSTSRITSNTKSATLQSEPPPLSTEPSKPKFDMSLRAILARNSRVRMVTADGKTAIVEAGARCYVFVALKSAAVSGLLCDGGDLVFAVPTSYYAVFKSHDAHWVVLSLKTMKSIAKISCEPGCNEKIVDIRNDTVLIVNQTVFPLATKYSIVILPGHRVLSPLPDLKLGDRIRLSSDLGKPRLGPDGSMLTCLQPSAKDTFEATSTTFTEIVQTNTLNNVVGFDSPANTASRVCFGPEISIAYDQQTGKCYSLSNHSKVVSIQKSQDTTSRDRKITYTAMPITSNTVALQPLLHEPIVGEAPNVGLSVFRVAGSTWIHKFKLLLTADPHDSKSKLFLPTMEHLQRKGTAPVNSFTSRCLLVSDERLITCLDLDNCVSRQPRSCGGELFVFEEPV